MWLAVIEVTWVRIQQPTNLSFNLFFLQKNGYVATNLPYFLFKAANTSPSI
jgi:hypothetical protein